MKIKIRRSLEGKPLTSELPEQNLPPPHPRHASFRPTSVSNFQPKHHRFVPPHSSVNVSPTPTRTHRTHPAAAQLRPYRRTTLSGTIRPRRAKPLSPRTGVRGSALGNTRNAGPLRRTAIRAGVRTSGRAVAGAVVQFARLEAR